MRRTLLSLSLSLVLGCGSSDEASRLFGDFTPLGGTAVLFAPAVCNLPFVGQVSVAAVAVALTSDADACGFVTATQFCGTRQGSSAVVGVALQGELGNGGVAGATPGTYVFLASPPTGPFRAALADAAKVDGACTPVQGGAPDLVGGSITISSLAADHVVGSFALRFEGDQALDEPFDVAVCPVSIDLCAFLTVLCFDRVCAPAL